MQQEISFGLSIAIRVLESEAYRKLQMSTSHEHVHDVSRPIDVMKTAHLSNLPDDCTVRLHERLVIIIGSSEWEDRHSESIVKTSGSCEDTTSHYCCVKKSICITRFINYTITIFM